MLFICIFNVFSNVIQYILYFFSEIQFMFVMSCLYLADGFDYICVLT